MAKKVNIKTVKPEENENTIKKVKKEKIQKEKIVNEDRKEKITKILDEIKAFLIIDLIVFIVAFAGYYWYTHFYSEDNHHQLKEEKELKDYKVSKYTIPNNHQLKIINDKYIVEYNEDTLYKIMDMKTKSLYENETEYTNVYIGIDNKLYLTKTEETDSTNVIYLYTIEDNNLIEIKELRENGAYYAPIKYYENKESSKSYLLGFTAVKSTYDEDMNEINKSYIYTLDGQETELNNYELYGDSITLKETAREIISYDERYIIINSINNLEKRYGLYDLEDKKVIIKPQYEGLFTNKKDEYIAIKNNKYGIVNKSLKKIVDFEYDFIDKNKEYYIVSKSNKMALMNSNYDLITKYEFMYQSSNENIEYHYLNDGLKYNTFTSNKINDKYILVTNNNEYLENIEYPKHETYIINNDGTYETIEANEFYVDPVNSLIYSYNKENKKYTFYDQDLQEKFKIDISSYDYETRATVKLINENTLVINMDSEVYYDYTTGEEIEDIKDYQTENNKIEINYTRSKKELSYKFDNKELISIKVPDKFLSQKYFINIDDNSFYFKTDKEYLIVYKGE